MRIGMLKNQIDALRQQGRGRAEIFWVQDGFAGGEGVFLQRR